jgi:hypothetical protein
MCLVGRGRASGGLFGVSEYLEPPGTPGRILTASGEFPINRATGFEPATVDPQPEDICVYASLGVPAVPRVPVTPLVRAEYVSEATGGLPVDPADTAEYSSSRAGIEGPRRASVGSGVCTDISSLEIANG